MATKINTARTVANIRADIVSVVKTDATFDITVHNLAVECLQHAAPKDMGGHGDISLLAQLIGDCKTAGGAAFGRGVKSRRLALIEWLTAFSPVRLNGDGVIGLLPTTSKVFVPFNVDGGTATPYYEMGAEKDRRSTNKPFSVSTMLARIGSFTKAIDKSIEAETFVGDVEAAKQFATEVNAWAAIRARELGLTDAAGQAVKSAATPESLEIPFDTVVKNGEDEDKAVA